MVERVKLNGKAGGKGQLDHGPTTYLFDSGVAVEVTSSVGRPPPVTPMKSDWPTQA